MITPIRKEPHTALDGPQYYKLLLQQGASAYQPKDADLTAIAGLSTTSFGRGFLTQADDTAARSYIGAGTGSGSGTVTNFSAGDLSPLFTTSEATTTTTPALTFALSNAAANTFFGNGTGSSAAPTFMSASTLRTAAGLVIGTDIQAYNAGIVIKDANSNIAVNNSILGLLVTPTSAGTLNLTAASAFWQRLTGSTTHIVALPDPATLANGHSFIINNASSGLVTVTTFLGTTLLIVAASRLLRVTCIDNTVTTTAAWRATYDGTAVLSGKAFLVNNSLTLSGTDGSTLNVGAGGTLGTAAFTAASAYQAVDATLTALAALTIAADSLSIGTAADAFSQTTFAANTFPAKASTGNLVAKTITDFGLSLVDDADASAARTTLGLVIGTNVQAYDADLTTWAGVTPASGIAAWLATPSSANLKTAVTDETGSGALVFATSPTLVTPLLGTPTSGTLSNCTSTTQSPGDNSTKLATTAYTDAAVTAKPLPITGSYTPTGTDISGTTGITAEPAQWMQVGSGIGSIVTVSGKVRVDFSAVLVPTLVQFQLDLPVASSLGNETECGGAGVSNEGLIGVPVRIFAAILGGAQFDFIATTPIGSRVFISYSFTYSVQ